ncbi:MAG: sigma-70 family RNA polymerase sigma factor [Cyanobacteria bacterium P01_F01_bin.53]
MTASESDSDLVYRLWEGNLTALGVIYDRYSSVVYGVALKGLRSVSEAEDLTQEVFCKLARSRSYDPQRGSLAKYLTVLTRSRAIDRLRSRATRQKYADKWQQLQVPSDFKTPMHQVTQQERHVLVREAMSTLKDRQREVLEMSYYEGQSQSEIADRLGVPLGTVKSWARRGLLHLREQLRHVLEEEKS